MAKSRPHNPIKDLDILAEILVIQRLKKSGSSGILPLIGYLSDEREELAAAAVRSLLGLIPMAALPLRWRADLIYRKPSKGSNLPPWLEDASNGWGDENDFAHQCVQHLNSLNQASQRQRYIQRLTLFMGARQRIVTCMLAGGHKSAAREFSQAAHRLQQIQFPKQVTLALTLNCQLSCQYCISGTSSQSDFHETEPQAIEQLLNWMQAQGIKRLGLTGGEPTLYTDFERFLDQLKDRGFELYLATNGLASKTTLAAIKRAKPLCVTMHLTPEVRASKRLNTYVHNARELMAAGVYVIMRCNFLNRTDRPTSYLDTAIQAGISEIRTAIPMPKASGGNCFVDFGEFKQYGVLLDQLAAAGEQAGVSIRLAKPFPVCFMARETARQFLENGSLAAACPVHFSGYTNNIIVNADLRYAACLGLDQLSEKSIVSYKRLTHAAAVHRHRVKSLIRQPIMPACTDCPLWIGGRCVGGCLSYREPQQSSRLTAAESDPR